MRESAPRPSEIVGSVKIEKGRTQIKREEPFAWSRAHIFTCLTLARHPYYLRAWHRLITYSFICFFFFIYFSYNFSFLFLLAMECRPACVIVAQFVFLPRTTRARFSEKLQRKCMSKCYCKRQIDNKLCSETTRLRIVVPLEFTRVAWLFRLMALRTSYMLHVKRASLDLWLKAWVILITYTCSVLVLTHGTRLPGRVVQSWVKITQG